MKTMSTRRTLVARPCDCKFQVTYSTVQGTQARNWKLELQTVDQNASQDPLGLNAQRGLGRLRMCPSCTTARSNLTDSLLPALDNFTLKRTCPPHSGKPSVEESCVYLNDRASQSSPLRKLAPSPLPSTQLLHSPPLSISQYRIVSSYPAMTCIPPRGFPRWLKTFTLLEFRGTMSSTAARIRHILSRHQACHEIRSIYGMTLAVHGKTSFILVQPTASRYGLPGYR
jgi:hypothetical protein